MYAHICTQVMIDMRLTKYVYNNIYSEQNYLGNVCSNYNYNFWIVQTDFYSSTKPMIQLQKELSL